MDEKLQNDLRAYFDTNLSRMSEGSKVKKSYVDAFPRCTSAD